MQILFSYQLCPDIYTIEDPQEVVYLLGDQKGTIHIEYDDLNKKTNLILTPFGSTFGSFRFDENSFFIIFLDSVPYWDYKSTNAIHVDFFGVCPKEKILNLSAIDKNRLKCDCINGSVQNNVRQPNLSSFFVRQTEWLQSVL